MTAADDALRDAASSLHWRLLEDAPPGDVQGVVAHGDVIRVYLLCGRERLPFAPDAWEGFPVTYPWEGVTP